MDSRSAGVTDETAVLSSGEQAAADVGTGSGVLNSLRRLQSGLFGGGAGAAETEVVEMGQEPLAAAAENPVGSVLAQAPSASPAGAAQPWWQAVLMVGLALLAADVAVYMAAQRGRVKVKQAHNLTVKRAHNL